MLVFSVAKLAGFLFVVKGCAVYHIFHKNDPTCNPDIFSETPGTDILCLHRFFRMIKRFILTQDNIMSLCVACAQLTIHLFQSLLHLAA